jgi:hypothetical protein
MPELSKTQRERFDNIVSRLTKKIEGTFGGTLEDLHVGEIVPSEFSGEEISQTIEIESRGVHWNITVAAGRSDA